MMASGMGPPSTASVWTQFGDRLRRFIAKRLREESDIEDVLQEVFTKIHAGLGTLKHSQKLEAWLFQVARRAIHDHLRRCSLKRRPGELPEEIAEKTPPPTVISEVASWLEPMMDLLPREDRLALRLADLDGLPQKELASRWGISGTAAKSRVQRARRRLKEVLLECCHIEVDRRGNAIGYRPREGNCRSCSCG
jgi:RNA polymerase sigma-70 factor (ECF subfamily)